MRKCDIFISYVYTSTMLLVRLSFRNLGKCRGYFEKNCNNIFPYIYISARQLVVRGNIREIAIKKFSIYIYDIYTIEVFWDPYFHKKENCYNLCYLYLQAKYHYDWNLNLFSLSSSSELIKRLCHSLIPNQPVLREKRRATRVLRRTSLSRKGWSPPLENSPSPHPTRLARAPLSARRKQSPLPKRSPRRNLPRNTKMMVSDQIFSPSILISIGYKIYIEFYYDILYIERIVRTAYIFSLLCIDKPCKLYIPYNIVPVFT